VLEVADILRAAGPEVCAQLARLPSQRRALQAILQCRTAALGGQVYGCEQCGALQYSYHSCGNRHCPKCHGQQTEPWLEQQRARLLPVPYYLLTFTLPAPLRALARSHQKLVYGWLLKAAAASIQKLCADPRWLGAQPSLMGVLHTWTRALLYHPHAHFLVSAGGLSLDGQRWQPAKNPKFLLPVRALSLIFRAQMRDGLKAAGVWQQVPTSVWKQPWVVHAQPAGSGQKVLDYLGRYVFRIAISQSRLERLEAGQVTFRYRDNRTQQIKQLQLPVQEFVRRFLQHVLPKGWAKVRHYGLDSSACRQRHARAQALLQAACASAPAPAAQPPTPIQATAELPTARRCPHCGTGRLFWRGQLWPSHKIPP
jgi:hypothetical protein